jgi:hypothetical protein
MTMRVSTCTNGRLPKLKHLRTNGSIALKQGHRFGV